MLIVVCITTFRAGSDESCAFTDAVNDPNAAGAPLIAPDALPSMRPGGSVPDGIDQTTAPTLPLADPVRTNARPTRPDAAAAIDALNGAAETTSVSAFVSVFAAQLASPACTVTLKVPTLDGVPDSTPAGDRLTPLGSAPETMANVAAPVPPVAASAAEYAA